MAIVGTQNQKMLRYNSTPKDKKMQGHEKRQLRAVRDGHSIFQLGVVELRRWEAADGRVHAVLHVQHSAGLPQLLLRKE